MERRDYGTHVDVGHEQPPKRPGLSLQSRHKTVEQPLKQTDELRLGERDCRFAERTGFTVNSQSATRDHAQVWEVEIDSLGFLNAEEFEKSFTSREPLSDETQEHK